LLAPPTPDFSKAKAPALPCVAPLVLREWHPHSYASSFSVPQFTKGFLPVVAWHLFPVPAPEVFG
jgi:hypothetical protein